MDSRHYDHLKIDSWIDKKELDDYKIAAAIKVNHMTVKRARRGIQISFETLADITTFLGFPVTSVIYDYPKQDN